MSWESVNRWCKRWLGIIAAVVVILGGVYGIVRYIVKSEVSEMAHNVETIGATLKPLPEAISSLKDRATKMETHWEDMKIRDLSQRPVSNESIGAINKALNEAKDANLKLSDETIQEAGNRFLLLASAKNRAAWDAALAFLDYRSSLNINSLPLALTPSTGTSKYRESVTIIPNPDHPEMHAAFQVSFAGGHESSEKSARLESLDKPQSEGSEFAFYIVDGALDTIVLDRAYMKHVVIRNADVQYDGGPIRLEDVYFVNCTFHSRFKLTPRTINLSRQLLASAAVTFPEGQPSTHS